MTRHTSWRDARTWIAVIALLLGSVATVAPLRAAPPSSRASRPAPLEARAAERELERLLGMCFEGPGHVFVTRSWHRTDLRFTGTGSRTHRCDRVDYRFLPEPPVGARVLYELEVAGGVARLRGVRTENTGGLPPI